MFSSLTALTYETTAVENISVLVNKSRKTILADLATFSRQIHKTMDRSNGIVSSELLKYIPDDNAYNCILLSEIFYREISYCKRAIEFIGFICCRYKDEEDDELEGTNDWDYDVETLPQTVSDIQQSSYQNKLSQQLMIGSNLLHTRLHTYLKRFVDSELSFNFIHDRFLKSIESLDTTVPSPTHGQLQSDFQDLYSLSNHAWTIMTLLASFNLFRLSSGSVYEFEPVVPNGSIFYKRKTFE